MNAEMSARRGLIDRLTEQGSIRTSRVCRAFESVRRSTFIPDAPLDEVYADRTHVVAEDDGITVSTVSAPSMQAVMLELLRPEPGMDVLEIGSGGTNAALLAAAVAPGGSVWTVDIDERVVDRARASLAQHPTASPVRVDCVDAWAADSPITAGRFDLVEFTVATWTLPTWLPAALRPGGGWSRRWGCMRSDAGGASPKRMADSLVANHSAAGSWRPVVPDLWSQSRASPRAATS